MVLLVVSLFIISNTIKLVMYDRKEEIAIMKMVGATNGFIRVPFVIEGGHLTGDIELRLVSVIEYALRLKVTSMTFETERCIDEYSWAPSVYVHIERYDIKHSDKYISIDGVIFTSDKKTLVLFPEGRTGEYTIPDHVLTVSEDAFAKLVYKKELDGFAVDTRVEQVRK